MLFNENTKRLLLVSKTQNDVKGCACDVIEPHGLSDLKKFQIHTNDCPCVLRKCEDLICSKPPQDVFEKVKLDRKRKKACKDSNNVADDVDASTETNRGKEVSCENSEFL